jgi:hypothetical protein
VVMEWSGYFTSEEFRNGTNAMLDTLKEFNATRVLANVKEMVLISMEDQKWMESVFLPRAIEAGFRICALVQPVHYFNKVAVENITYKIDQRKLLVNIFDNLVDAKKWLVNEPLPGEPEKDHNATSFNVYYDAGLKAVVMEWKGYFTTGQFRECSERMLATLQEHTCSKVLGNIREMTLIQSSEQQWLQDEFLPKAHEKGLLYCALVKPENFFNRIALDNVTYNIDQDKLEVVMCNTLEEARTWLKEK